MNNTLVKLAEAILYKEKGGLSKVRFAKTIYFVHKELVRNKLLKATDIEYIRMPLGPVPVGFMSLQDQRNVSVFTKSTQLMYNATVYTISDEYTPDQGKVLDAITSTLVEIDHISTSLLVELSHKDPSWAGSFNGVEYFIKDVDLKNKLPKKSKTQKVDPELDEQLIQSKLISGMMPDIVGESTDLEYPSQE